MRNNSRNRKVYSTRRRKKVTKIKMPNIVFSIFLLFIIALYCQFFYLSTSREIYGIDMQEFASNRNTKTKTILAERGKIFDVNGDVLALNVTSYTLIAYLDPSRKDSNNKKAYVYNKEETAKKLAEVLDADYDYILEKLNSKLYQVQFGSYGRNITELKKKEIEDLNLTGIDFEQTTNRYYPSGNFASYIIGYAKVNDQGKITGMLGSENVFDKQLTGKDGYYTYEQDKYGYKIPDTPEKKVDAQNGDDIYLTIDSSIQRFVESAIYEVDNEYKPEWTLIEVMDAKTGAILGSGASTSFDPNNIPNDMSYENPLISYAFEPGSTMKIFTYLCAIDKGVYNGGEKYLSGTYKVDENDSINDWNKSGWGEMTFDRGFEYSSNVAIANIIEKYLSKSELKSCFQKYGFGNVTDIELTGENAGALNFKYDIEVLAAGYGQGILTTPVQHLQALSIIANNGYMVTPHIVSKTVSDATKKEQVTKVKRSSRIVSESTVNQIKDLMENVIKVEDATGHKYYIEGFDIIGKTGTAQIYENGHYLTGTTDYISSISMMYPKDDPKIIIYAATKKPNKNQNYALADGVKGLTKNIAKYYNMFTKNDNTDDDLKHVMENYISTNIDDAKEILKNKNVSVTIIGNGNTVVKQYPKKNTNLTENNIVILVTNSSDKKMPSIIGWSRIDVIKLCDLLNIEYNISGTGVVKSQSIKEGSKIEGKLEVNLGEMTK